MKNTKRTAARVSLWIALVGLLMMVLPMNMGLDGMNGGFALAFIGLFVIITGLVSWYFYNRLANEQDRLFGSQYLLAEWTYSPEEWQQYTNYNYAERKNDNKMLWRLIAGISLVVCVLFVFIMGEDAIMPTLITFIGILAITGIAAIVSTRSALKHSKSDKPIVLVSEKSVYLNGELHAWDMLTSHLTNVEIKQERGVNIIELTYAAIVRYGEQTYTARVPVPKGHEVEGEKVAARLSARIS